MQSTTIGIDIAKNVLHLVGVNKADETLVKKAIKRG